MRDLNLQFVSTMPFGKGIYMQRSFILTMACLGVVAVAGCDKGDRSAPAAAVAQASCSSPLAAKLIKDIVNDSVEARAREENKDLPEANRLDLSKIRALADEVQFDLQDVITTKNDPNSTKKFCEGYLSIRVPDGTLTNANDKRKEVGKNAIKTLAEDANFKADLNKFTKKVAYDVQPTDDGKKIYVGLERGSGAQDLVSETVIWAAVNLRQAEVRTSSIQAAATAPATAPAPAVAPPPVGDAQAAPVAPAVQGGPAPASAALADSTEEYQAAEREINVVWKSLPKPVRDAHLEAQRAFNVAKEATCFKEATAAGTGEQFEIARNKCWTRFYKRRTPELRMLM